MGLPMLCLSRWLVGLGEGVAPSAATALLVRESSRVTSHRFRAHGTGSPLDAARWSLLCFT